MLRFAATGVTSFSAAPLRARAEPRLRRLVRQLRRRRLSRVVAKIAGFFTVPGWASIVVVVTLIGGIQLIVLGVIGVYIGDIHAEVKRRPLYVVSELENFDDRAVAAARAPSSSRRARAPPRRQGRPRGASRRQTAADRRLVRIRYRPGPTVASRIRASKAVGAHAGDAASTSLPRLARESQSDVPRRGIRTDAR